MEHYEPSKLKDDGLTWQQRGWRHNYENLANISEYTKS